MLPVEIEKLRTARDTVEGVLEQESRLSKANLPDRVAHENLAALSAAVLQILDALEGANAKVR